MAVVKCTLSPTLSGRSRAGGNQRTADTWKYSTKLNAGDEMKPKVGVGVPARCITTPAYSTFPFGFGAAAGSAAAISS